MPRKVVIESMKVVLLGKEGFSVKLSVHRDVLIEKSGFFSGKILEQSDLSCLQISDCEDVEIYFEAVGFTYCKEMKQRLMKQNASRILRTLKLIEFLKGLVGGVMFIFSIHAVNAFLGCASFSWPHIPPSLGVMAWVKLCGLVGLLIVQGTVMASAISLVEELLFRSWNHNSRAGIFFLAEIVALIRVYHCSTAGVQSVRVLRCFECAKD